MENDLVVLRSEPDLHLVTSQLASVAAHLAEITASQHSLQTIERNELTGTDLAEMAANAYRLRREREKVFNAGELFGEPAWDILLDLYQAQMKGRPVSVTSACIASNSPTTTGLRWLRHLEEAGLIERKKDPHDNRRMLVRLTRPALEKMETFLRRAAFEPFL